MDVTTKASCEDQNKKYCAANLPCVKSINVKDGLVAACTVCEVPELYIQFIPTNNQAEPDNFGITPSAGSNGSISPSVVSYYDRGSNATFRFTPDANYWVDDVLIDGVSIGVENIHEITSLALTNITAQHTIEVIFSLQQFEITSSAGSNGSISSSGYYDYGTNATFVFTPDANYWVDDVLIDGVSIDVENIHEIDSITITNITAIHTIAVNFSIQSFAITSSAGSNGSVSPSGLDNYNYGTDQEFTFTPGEGYEVADVLVDGESVGVAESYTFTNITTSHTISVSFSIVEWFVDNGDSGYAEIGSGWVNGAIAGGYEGDYRYHALGSGNNKARWSIDSLVSGTYEVFVRWVGHSSNASNSPFTVYDGSDSEGTVAVNQKLATAGTSADGFLWHSLGSYSITNGSLRVELTDAANGYVVADAIYVKAL